MRLIELSANQKSFNTIRFNPLGVSIIAAVQETPDGRKTYNSVGKSLSIALIHFCLASSKIEDFALKLPSWVFSLKFQIGNKEYTSQRATENQNKIVLNGTELSLKAFRNELADLLFDLPDKAPFLGFRPLISRFIRNGKKSYSAFDSFVAREGKNDFQVLLNNSFLLGLDPQIILRKRNLKKELDNIETFKKNIEKDPTVKKYFTSGDHSNLDIKIVDLTEQKIELETNINQFKIAEDYYAIRKEADEISAELRKLRNQAEKIRAVIADIESSLIQKPDISLKDVRTMYEKANIALQQMVLKKLAEVEEFHERLLENRFQRLVDEKRIFEHKLSEIEAKILIRGREEDNKLQYLNAHGALEEYTKLNRRLSDLEIQLDKLNQYKLLQSEYRDQIEKIKQRFSRDNITTNRYLTEASEIIQANIRTFRDLAKEFYKDKEAGISILNNDGENTLRFEMDVRIEDDAGDAVNEVKIFCFDWTILKGQHNHHVNFLYHDSRITDGVDPRQVSTMLKIADRETAINGFQYILSLNQNVINDLRNTMKEDDFRRIVKDNIVLTLSDRSDETKLLGVRVDLSYDK